jgi:hypothetical protein
MYKWQYKLQTTCSNENGRADIIGLKATSLISRDTRQSVEERNNEKFLFDVRPKRVRHTHTTPAVKRNWLETRGIVTRSLHRAFYYLFRYGRFHGLFDIIDFSPLFTNIFQLVIKRFFCFPTTEHGGLV